MKLPYTRFVRQVSNGGSFSRYGYIEMMQRNAAAIKTKPWHEAVCDQKDVSLTVNQLSRTDGVLDDSNKWVTPPTYTAWIDDRYDAFAQAGDAVKEMASMCGYLGCVAYRFTLPTLNPSDMTSIELYVQRDRYLRSGVRVCLFLSDNPAPINDWDGIIHADESNHDMEVFVYPPKSERTVGDGVLGVSSWGFLGQKDVPNLLAGRAEGGSFMVSPSDFPSLNGSGSYKYLYVFLTLEDDTAYWDMYSEEEKRFYYIEGSAVLVASSCNFEFSNPDTGFDEEPWHDAIFNLKTMRDSIVGIDETGGSNRYVGPDLLRMNGLSGFISSPGRLQVMAPIFNKYMESMPRKLFHSGGGELVSSMSEGEGFGWGDPTVYVRISSMEIFANWPRWFNTTQPTYPNEGRDGLLFMARKCGSGYSGSADLEILRNGDGVGYPALRGYTQVVFGYIAVVVPQGLSKYSTMRITRDTEFPFSCDKVWMSLNIWRSESFSCIGQFANAAFAALAQNPEMFTGGKITVSGKCSFTLDDYYKRKSSGSFTVDATARLIYNVSAEELLADGSITIDNLSLNPGDVILVAPKVDGFNVSSDWDGSAFFGKAYTEFLPPVNQSGLQVSISFR